MTNTKLINGPDYSLAGLRADIEKILDDSDNKEEDCENLQVFEDLRITDKTAVPSPVPFITISGEIISTAGNITTISGPPKSGKTATVSVIEAGAISRDGNIDGIEGIIVKPNPECKAVLHFDTEQARHKHKYNVLTILRRAKYNHCPDHFLSYNIRGLETKNYQDTTRQICGYADKKFKGIHLIVIDGLADFISDVNDPEQSNAVIKWAEQLAIDFNCPVLVIIHTNPNSDKERGHLGSQAQRKSESVIQVKTDSDISYIEPKFLRNASKANILAIQFIYDKEKGYHIGCGIRSQDHDGKDKQRVDTIRVTCSSVFGQNSYSYQQALDAIMRNTTKGERLAKDIFKEMRAHGMIIKDGELWRLVVTD